MRDESKYIPVIGIHEFRKEQLVGGEELLFNELRGDKYIDKPHKHDFFIINLFDQARGAHNIDFRDYAIEDRQVHLLFPGQVHTWNIKLSSTGYQLMIPSLFFEKFASYFRFSFTDYMNHPVIPLSGESFELLKYEFEAIRDELARPGALPELINARAAVIAALVSKEAECVLTDHKVYLSNPRLARFNELIDKYFREEKQVAFYASKLNISANYLNILCKKHLQVSAAQLIQQRVLLEAKRLLRSTDFSIKEIAFGLGFVDHAYFTNFFKRWTGLAPTMFRDK